MLSGGNFLKIIIISGRMASGKTTLQNKLSEKFDHMGALCEEVNFADVIYEIHDEAILILNKYIDYPVVKDRKLLQLLGKEYGRDSISPDIWVSILKSKIEKFKAYPFPPEFIFIGDCRFENEFDAFPGALRVRLECSEHLRKIRCSKWSDEPHESEFGLDTYAALGKFDMYIDTEKTSIDGCMELVSAQLVKNNWQEKRK